MFESTSLVGGAPREQAPCLPGGLSSRWGKHCHLSAVGPFSRDQNTWGEREALPTLQPTSRWRQKQAGEQPALTTDHGQPSPRGEKHIPRKPSSSTMMV